MFSDLEGGEGETQDDGSSEKIGMVYMATGSLHLFLPFLYSFPVLPLGKMGWIVSTHVLSNPRRQLILVAAGS